MRPSTLRCTARALAVAAFLFATGAADAHAQRAWRPDMSAGEAAVDGATAILFGAVSNVARELIGWPH